MVFTKPNVNFLKSPTDVQYSGIEKGNSRTEVTSNSEKLSL